MDIRYYQTFLTLAETRHFGQAAARCHMSPSAVSRQLQRLEQQVGQRLIERDNRQVHLTPAGRHFLEYARKAVDDWQQLRSDLSASQTTLSGTVTVYGSVTASYGLMTQILPRMREVYPGVEIKLRTGDQADGMQRVLRGEEDAAIIARPDHFPDKLEFLPLQRTPLHLIGPRTPSALSRQLDRCIATGEEPDWPHLPMVLAERGLARERLLAWLQTRGHAPNIYAQEAGHEVVVPMVSPVSYTHLTLPTILRV